MIPDEDRTIDVSSDQHLDDQHLDDLQDDLRVVAAVKQFLALLESGKAPPVSVFLDQHAAVADRLRPSLEGLAMVHRAAPLPSIPSDVSLPDTEYTGKPIGDFQIVGEIGRGGMGVVYEAIQLSLGRRVALKVLPFASGLDDVRLQRFRNEAHAAAALHHTNIVPVYAVGSDRGIHYFAMQLIEGHTLATLIGNMRDAQTPQAPFRLGPQPSGTLDAQSRCQPRSQTTTAVLSTLLGSHADRLNYYRSVVRMTHQAVLAIEHAHRYGVVHRDIKPANLLIDAAGKIWVTDFGLAQVQSGEHALTRTGDPMGTLRYMSPEQAAGDRSLLDHRTDIYSLGVTLYELLTLQPAIRGEGYREMLNQIADQEPLAPKSVDSRLPVELDTIVRKAIAKSPGERYATAQALAEDLQSWLDDRPIRAKPPTTWERMAKWRRRNSALVAGVSGLLLITTVGMSVTTMMVWQEQQQTRRALIRETEQRELAEQSFSQARFAVETFSELSETELAYRPELQDLRRSFLETTLEFYRDFIAQRQDDPALASDLAATSVRVERIVDELRILDSLSPLFQLDDPRVQAALGIVDEQARLIQEVLEAFQSATRAGGGRSMDHPSILAETWTAGESDDRAGLLKGFESFMTQQLTPEQDRRLRQIARQRRLPFTFKTPEVITALGLTHEQRVEINRIMVQTGPMRKGPPDHGDESDRRRLLKMSPPGPSSFRPEGMPGERFRGGPLGGPDRSRSDITQKTVTEILKILTPDQRAKWNELVGEPFL